MSDLNNVSDVDLEERIDQLDALADGCVACFSIREQRADLMTILAARSAHESAPRPGVVDWIDFEIDHAIAAARLLRGWAAEAVEAGEELGKPGVPSVAAINAAVKAFELLSVQLEEAKR